MDFNIEDPAVLQQLNKIMKSPKLFSETFLNVPGENGEVNPFRAHYCQNLIYDSDKLVTYICMHRRSGKSLVGSTLIIDPKTFKPIPLKDASHFTECFSFDFSLNQIIKVPCHWEKTGVKHTIKLKLGSGDSLQPTSEHLLFHWKKGWVRSDEIRVGDRILGPTEIPVFGDVSATTEEIDKAVNYTVFGEIPDVVYQFNRNSLCRYLFSLWSKTGRVFKDESLVSFILQEKSLAFPIQHFLYRLGVSSRVDDEGDIFIYDPIDISLFLNSIGYGSQIIDVHSPRRWEIITDISGGGVEDVYDLIVEHQDRNYVANNMVVHNSFALATLALWHAVSGNNTKVRIFVPASDQQSAIFSDIHSFINYSDFLLALKSGSTKDPQRIDFSNGSEITGHLLGIDSNLGKGRRGITADIVIVDESQSVTKEHWRVLSPIISGDQTRFGKIKAYIAGTITLPPEPFYKKVFTYVQDGWCEEHEKVIYLPVTKNPEITSEMMARYRADCKDEDTWNTEWLLLPGALEKGVFRTEDVVAACSENYNYSPENIKPNYNRFITVDWDKCGAGTNIMVTQYSPIDRKLHVIFREEVPPGPFTYTVATERILELANEYSPQLILLDSGQGEHQIEWITAATGRAHLMHLQDRIIRVNFGTAVKTYDPSTGEEIKPAPRLKEWLIALLKRFVNDRRLKYSGKDTLITEQLLAYKEISRTESHVRYTRNNEHLIDCLAMACYGLNMIMGAEIDVIPVSTEKVGILHVPEDTSDTWPSEKLDVFHSVSDMSRDSIGEDVSVYKRPLDDIGAKASFSDF